MGERLVWAKIYAIDQTYFLSLNNEEMQDFAYYIEE